MVANHEYNSISGFTISYGMRYPVLFPDQWKISLDKGRHFEFLKEEMATYQIPSPDQMNCNGDIAINWKTFRESYDDYIVATGLVQKDKIIQVATLKSLMGIECKKILKRLQLSEDEMKDPKTILDKLQDHFLPVRNILYERYAFHNTDQFACT